MKITSEIEEEFRIKLKDLICNEDFDFKSLKITGNSRKDVEDYLNRTEESRSYDFEFVLNNYDLPTNLNILSKINTYMKDIFGESKESKMEGSSDLEGSITKNNLIRLVKIVFKYDPNQIENGNVFKNIYNVNKFNL